MAETLLSPSNVLLYGRVVTDLEVVHEGSNPSEEEIHRPFISPRVGKNKFLQAQLEDPDARLARIYGFSYEGQYYDMAKPALFLVHGDGERADDPVGSEPRKSRAPDLADKTGVAAQGYSFPEDMRVWSYDTGDHSIRLDIQTGPFDQILLDAETRLQTLEGAYTGATLRMSGATARASARLSGATARLRGNRGEWSD